MRFILLHDGRWSWSFRLAGMVGQAYGEALSRAEAIEQAMRRLKLSENPF